MKYKINELNPEKALKFTLQETIKEWLRSRHKDLTDKLQNKSEECKRYFLKGGSDPEKILQLYNDKSDLKELIISCEKIAEYEKIQLH